VIGMAELRGVDVLLASDGKQLLWLEKRDRDSALGDGRSQRNGWKRLKEAQEGGPSQTSIKKRQEKRATSGFRIVVLRCLCLCFQERSLPLLLLGVAADDM
jgi:hypothetical protein